MIIPSIDLSGGQAVQLVGGRDKALDLGDPSALLERFRVVGPVAVVDLDAALGQRAQEEQLSALVARGPCLVGGGLRDVPSARRWLDAGALKVVIGTAATPEFLRQLPRERVVVALDARHGEVVVDGWRQGTGRTVEDRMEELRPFAGAFLVTFVEREGRLLGLDSDRARALVEAARPSRVTVAGGIKTAEEVRALDRIGADAQVGMALHTGHLDLGDALAQLLDSDRSDGLWPTVVVEENGGVLGLAWSDAESLRNAVAERRGVYHSRKRGLWIKGEKSGNTQILSRVEIDCDRDALQFVVRQQGAGFCHTGTWSCFGDDCGVPRLARRLRERLKSAPEGSYTRRLLEDPTLLASKLKEEAQELGAAETPSHIAEEAADLLYFALVRLTQAGVGWSEVAEILDRRELRVTRRAGDAKSS